ncbi:hypothetical protein GCM10017667_76280 [Streptomyces filamentosus]|uniref:Uncharacterized protein n=1 Tax=Streptomyces filamentosus TaxID=67294 RepID=A0A919BXX3_STRFL|nr:hypothetical protein GCM10017667_76280 [Streptomyces filamentosus]
MFGHCCHSSVAVFVRGAAPDVRAVVRQDRADRSGSPRLPAGRRQEHGADGDRHEERSRTHGRLLLP